MEVDTPQMQGPDLEAQLRDYEAMLSGLSKAQAADSLKKEWISDPKGRIRRIKEQLKEARPLPARLQAATHRVETSKAKFAETEAKVTELKASLVAAELLLAESATKVQEAQAELQAVTEMAARSVCATSAAAAGSLAGTAMTLVAGLLAQLEVPEASQQMVMAQFAAKMNEAAGVPTPTPQAQQQPPQAPAATPGWTQSAPLPSQQASQEGQVAALAEQARTKTAEALQARAQADQMAAEAEALRATAQRHQDDLVRQAAALKAAEEVARLAQEEEELKATPRAASRERSPRRVQGQEQEEARRAVLAAKTPSSWPDGVVL